MENIFLYIIIRRAKIKYAIQEKTKLELFARLKANLPGLYIKTHGTKYDSQIS